MYVFKRSSTLFKSLHQVKHVISCQRHDYYCQIQGQLGIIQRSRHDFVSWTSLESILDKSPYDPTSLVIQCVSKDFFCSFMP